MKVVKSYLDGEEGYKTLAKKFGIPSPQTIKVWVASYKEFGAEGLINKKQSTNYTLDFKLEVVKYYLTEEISYKNLAMKFGINNPSLVTAWVGKFREKGKEGLSKTKGCSVQMRPKKEKNSKNIKSTNHIDTNVSESKRIKELEKENRYLQIENAYLKELRRLRLEEARGTKKKQESSTASEDYSN